MSIDNSEKPPRVAPRLKSAPKIRQFYWCDFPKDAQLPEFWKRRPVIIISFKQNLSSAVSIVPCTTQPQTGNKWAVEISNTFDGQKTWAICDKLTSIAVSRLSVDKSGIQRVGENEFNQVLERLLEWLPKPQNKEKP